MTEEVPATWTYAFLILPSALLLVWLLLFVMRKGLRRNMFWVSLVTALLGLNEPLFVPQYWNPYTRFNLARRTGFDLESPLFSFVAGGIVFAAYDFFFRMEPSETMTRECLSGRHRHHRLAIGAAFLVFLIFELATKLNPIYSSTIALTVGFFATLYCRPDLWLKMIASTELFFSIYFVCFALFNLTYPGYVKDVWNLKAISGVLVIGVPRRADVRVRVHVRTVLGEFVRAPTKNECSSKQGDHLCDSDVDNEMSS